MKYGNGTKELVLTLSAEQLNIMKWFVDATYAVHDDFKSHTGMTMTMGQGAIMSMSQKQKLNTKSSTTAELVGADDATTMQMTMCLLYLCDKNQPLLLQLIMHDLWRFMQYLC